MIPALKTIIDKSSEMGIENVILGMPHRWAPHPAPLPSIASCILLQSQQTEVERRGRKSEQGCCRDLGLEAE